ncbi:hypothetical protein B0T16DRAFT_328528 [Cercophora newfieldiana]|uniref:SET domain-containing protein n=1 Tax=Cercophora newfieldiana TaxID=92897 RepID=A0AA39Y3K5_9PEZI|nr:hypothetical protein B0T16DRAFT_328528 [Cercophora newfieldiana]
MLDYPAVLVQMDFLAGNKAHHRRRLMKRAIEQLPKETKERVWKLQRGKGEHEVDKILGVNTQTVGVGDGLAIALFLEVARINHSCRPNAYYRFHASHLTMEIVSHSTIEAGDEITLNYAPLGMTYPQRTRFLKENWDIECTCSLCLSEEHDIKDSETARRQMEELRDTMLDARTNKFYNDAITIAKDWWYFCGLEGLLPLEMEYHDILADLYALKGDLENAIRYARMALDGWVRLGSVDSGQLENSRAVLMRLWAEQEAKIARLGA